MRSSKDAEGQKVLVCSDPATGPREKEHHPTRQNPTTCETNEFTMTHAEEKGRFAAVLRRTPNSPEAPIWKRFTHHIDLRDLTRSLDRVYLGCTQRATGNRLWRVS